MLIGYARISTTDQTLALQQDALTAAGCNRIFTDTTSGSRADRPGLTEALSYVRSGDTLVVWRLDRLGRSLGHLIQTVRELRERGVHFRSLQEQLDTATSGGKLVFYVGCVSFFVTRSLWGGYFRCSGCRPSARATRWPAGTERRESDAAADAGS
jgi:hypothetical protein